MNIPLAWLSEYVLLPSSVEELTNGLTSIGHMLDKQFTHNDEVVIDVELRGNRADLFSLTGMAREISTYWHTPLKLPVITTNLLSTPNQDILEVQATDVVTRFMAVAIPVTVTPSPEWLKQRLESYGMPSINSVVDITNFVMIETGIPLHAFDRAKLEGAKLCIRKAQPNETMITFQGTNVTLHPDDIVLADTKSPQAITQVGNQQSGTTETTQEIILEAAVYNPASVRRTARRLGIRTEAGNRLEKHLDPNMVPIAIARAIDLLNTLQIAKPYTQVSDYYPHPVTPQKINFSLSETQRLGGITIPPEEQQRILTDLGCICESNTSETLMVIVPTFRTDITQSADLVEEILRIHGYDHIPLSPLTGDLPQEMTAADSKTDDKIIDILIRCQFNQTINSSFLPEDYDLYHKPISTIEIPIAITNPPSPAVEKLRTSLLPQLLAATKTQFNRQQSKVTIFEVGTVFQQSNTKLTEIRRLGIVAAGIHPTPSYSATNAIPIIYDHLRGVITRLGQFFPIELEIIPLADGEHPYFQSGRTGCILHQDTRIGHIGMIDQHITTRLRIPHPVYAAELDLTVFDAIDSQISNHLYTLPEQYPSAYEDISFQVNPSHQLGKILTAIPSAHALINNVALVDTYGTQRTIRITIHANDRTVNAEDIRVTKQAVLELLNKQFTITPANQPK